MYLRTSIFFFTVMVLPLLSGCQAPPAPVAAQSAFPTNLPPTATEPIRPTFPGVTAVPSLTPAPTMDPTGPAADAVLAYFAALQAGDFKSAAGYLSNFSLVVAGMARADAAAELHTRMAAGMVWSNAQVKETQVFDAKTTLVRVVYRLSAPDAKSGKMTEVQVDELWPVRLENGEWSVNRDRLIDFRTLDVPDQTTAGLTVKPRALFRYTDRITLTLLVQNATNEAIVFGQSNEVMAAFLFGSQKVEAEKTRLLFDRLRSYPEVTVDVKGLFTAYPDGVELRRWKNVNVAPWFIFTFSD